MEKCVICRQKKGNRFCPAKQANICSLCCGTDRQKKIDCPASCEYLQKGEKYNFARQVERQINSSFETEEDDIFKNEKVVQFVGQLEMFFIENFYDDAGVNDNNIYNILVKIYLFQTKKIKGLEADNQCEELIFGEFNRLDRAVADISSELKAQSILRILKSIKSASGGIYGNRNYLEMVYSQFHKDGQWSHLF